MSGEGGGAGAGAGSAPVQTPAPFQMDSARLKQLMLKDDEAKLEELEDLLKGTVKVRIGTRGGEVGLNVTKDGTTVAYAWSTIARMWNDNTLHKEWGAHPGDLKELLESGS